MEDDCGIQYWQTVGMEEVEQLNKFCCPYCGKVYDDFVMCCGELHLEEIK